MPIVDHADPIAHVLAALGQAAPGIAQASQERERLDADLAGAAERLLTQRQLRTQQADQYSYEQQRRPIEDQQRDDLAKLRGDYLGAQTARMNGPIGPVQDDPSVLDEYDSAVEEALYGLSGDGVDPLAVERIGGLSESDFYRRDHQIIFRAILDLSGQGKPHDAVTLAEWFETQGVAEAVGGVGDPTTLGDLREVERVQLDGARHEGRLLDLERGRDQQCPDGARDVGADAMSSLEICGDADFTHFDASGVMLDSRLNVGDVVFVYLRR